MDKEVAKINKLIIEISKNNEQALAELFELTKEKMLYLAMKYLYDKSYSEDILSYLYLKVYSNASSFDQKSNGFNWMHQILKNTALDYNKLTKKQNYEKFDEEFYIQRRSSAELKKHEQLEIAMKQLNDVERNIVRLKIWERYTIKEIAAELNASTTYVYRTYKLALKKLRACMDELGGN